MAARVTATVLAENILLLLAVTTTSVGDTLTQKETTSGKNYNISTNFTHNKQKSEVPRNFKRCQERYLLTVTMPMQSAVVDGRTLF